MAAERIGQRFNIGRPNLISDELIKRVKVLKSNGRSIREITDTLAVGKSTIQRILKSLNDPYSKP
jgi:transposase